jgi:8-oxo-dGTP pyrophosphatase MutT (NUDIX family)
LELLDIYDNDGNVTGKVVKRGDKSVIFNENEHIAVSIIFIENNKNEFLIQKTSHIKGGEYSTTGGHVRSGESPLEAIKREVFEEIGIDINLNDIASLGFYKIGMPLRYLFYLKKDIDIKDVKLQEEEVESVKYMDELEIIELINKGEFLESHALLFKELINKNKS